MLHLLAFIQHHILLGEFRICFSSLINFIILIAISKLYDSDQLDEVKKHLSYSLKYFVALTIPFLFGITILGEKIMLLLTTPDIATQGKFLPSIIASSYLFLGIYTVYVNIIMVIKKTKLLTLVWFFSAPINVGLNFFLIPKIGLIGAALSTMFSYFLSMVIIVYFASRRFSFTINYSFILKSLFAAIVMSLFIFLADPVGILPVLSVLGGSILIYFLMLFLIGGIEKREIDFFKKTVQQFF